MIGRYVVPYGRYNLMETMPLAMMKHLEEDVPPVFMILDTYDKDVKVAISIPIQSAFKSNYFYFYFLCFFCWLTASFVFRLR